MLSARTSDPDFVAFCHVFAAGVTLVMARVTPGACLLEELGFTLAELTHCDAVFWLGFGILQLCLFAPFLFDVRDLVIDVFDNPKYALLAAFVTCGFIQFSFPFITPTTSHSLMLLQGLHGMAQGLACAACAQTFRKVVFCPNVTCIFLWILWATTSLGLGKIGGPLVTESSVAFAARVPEDWMELMLSRSVAGEGSGNPSNVEESHDFFDRSVWLDWDWSRRKPSQGSDKVSATNEDLALAFLNSDSTPLEEQVKSKRNEDGDHNDHKALLVACTLQVPKKSKAERGKLMFRSRRRDETRCAGERMVGEETAGALAVQDRREERSGEEARAICDAGTGGAHEVRKEELTGGDEHGVVIDQTEEDISPIFAAAEETGAGRTPDQHVAPDSPTTFPSLSGVSLVPARQDSYGAANYPRLYEQQEHTSEETVFRNDSSVSSGARSSFENSPIVVRVEGGVIRVVQKADEEGVEAQGNGRGHSVDAGGGADDETGPLAPIYHMPDNDPEDEFELHGEEHSSSSSLLARLRREHEFRMGKLASLSAHDPSPAAFEFGDNLKNVDYERGCRDLRLRGGPRRDRDDGVFE
eukprot:g10012.t1